MRDSSIASDAFELAFELVVRLLNMSSTRRTESAILDNDSIRRTLASSSIASTRLTRMYRDLDSITSILDSSNLASHLAVSDELTQAIRTAAYATKSVEKPLIELFENSAIAKFREQLIARQSRFLVPDTKSFAELFENSMFQNSLDIADSFRLPRENLRSILQEIDTAWIDSANEHLSIQAAAALSGIAHGIRAETPFDPQFASVLKSQLGNWESLATIPSNLHEDIRTRSDFYVNCGLNPSLTAFSPAAFHEITYRSGLEYPSIDVIEDYDCPPHEESDQSRDGLGRTNRAHDTIQRFETQIRACIDNLMTAAFGPNWYIRRVPEQMRSNWMRKRTIHMEQGRGEYPLIAFADFTDYVAIINRKDNWTEVFSPVFKNKMLVEESFRRLYPIRSCTMHSRPITQDDELYLFVEVKRLMTAIRTTH